MDDQLPSTRPRKAGVHLVVGLVLGIILAIGVILPALGNSRELARRANCFGRMKAIGFVMAMYADENDGKIPQSFEDARKYYSFDKASDKILICPSAKDSKTTNYQILLGGKKWNSPETTHAIVMSEPLANHRDGRNALYGDGHVAWLSN